MNKGEIRQLAKMYALVAKMNAINATIEGMKAENSRCLTKGLGPIHDRDAFLEAGLALELLEKKFIDTI